MDDNLNMLGAVQTPKWMRLYMHQLSVDEVIIK